MWRIADCDKISDSPHTGCGFFHVDTPSFLALPDKLEASRNPSSIPELAHGYAEAKARIREMRLRSVEE